MPDCNMRKSVNDRVSQDSSVRLLGKYATSRKSSGHAVIVNKQSSVGISVIIYICIHLGTTILAAGDLAQNEINA